MNSWNSDLPNPEIPSSEILSRSAKSLTSAKTQICQNPKISQICQIPYICGSADLQICKIPYIFGSKLFSKSVNWVSHLQTSDLQNSLQKVCRFLRSAKFLTKGLRICRFLQICKPSESAELSDLLNSLQKVNRFLRTAKILTKGLQICWFLLICQLSEFAELPDLLNSLHYIPEHWAQNALTASTNYQISANLHNCRSELVYSRTVD